ncbi:MAG: metallophosphoesterase family protein [Gemmatimonadaceae bacterium]
MAAGMPRRIGLISDTHGLLRPEVHGALAGVELILHAGDIGGETILLELGLIAPVRAVRGNCDPPDAPGLAAGVNLTSDGVSIQVTHGHELGVPTPAKLLARYDADVVVYGHTHRPLIERHGSRIVVNPGAAGPRRFDLMSSVAILTIDAGRAEARIVGLTAAP